LKVIKEFCIRKDSAAAQTIYITSGAKIVNVIDAGFDIVLLALCDYNEANVDLRTFKICHTHETIYHDNINYIGNDGCLHVIELL
jgi:hypothetical protein